MSIVDRIRAEGGEVIRSGYSITLRTGRLTPDAVAWIKTRKDDLMREVWPFFDDWQERAAIREFDGGQSRQDAERDAYQDILTREGAQC